MSPWAQSCACGFAPGSCVAASAQTCSERSQGRPLMGCRGGPRAARIGVRGAAEARICTRREGACASGPRPPPVPRAVSAPRVPAASQPLLAARLAFAGCGAPPPFRSVVPAACGLRGARRPSATHAAACGLTCPRSSQTFAHSHVTPAASSTPGAESDRRVRSRPC